MLTERARKRPQVAEEVPAWICAVTAPMIAATATRGVFTSVPDLKRKLVRYIRHYNKAPKAVKWKHFDPTRRITSQSAVTAH